MGSKGASLSRWRLLAAIVQLLELAAIQSGSFFDHVNASTPPNVANRVALSMDIEYS